MKQSDFIPQDQTYWYLNHSICKPLTQDITTDVVVIGGGMSGLSAAQAFHKKGLSVVLLEKNFCGSGASGKSSGFITPNSELSLYTLIDDYGQAEAKKLWDFASSGVEQIRANIKKYNLACDYQEQDTLVLASTANAYKSEIIKEHEARQKSGYTSTVYDAQNTQTIVGANAYYGALAYPNSFSIRSFAYCQGLKDILIQQGVKVYEETPVLDIQEKMVKTQNHSIKAERIIVCMDHFARHIPTLHDKVYHVQTFLMASAPLTEEQKRAIFPQHSYMAWDTDLIYHYFRLTPDNRLLVGGANLFDTYASEETHNNMRMARALTNYINTKFPQSKISFEYIWPGFIGVSKDLFPIAGFDEQNPSIYYLTAATGLPWAAALGNYAARHCLDGDDTFAGYFSPYRPFKIGAWSTKLLGTKLSFALSHYLTSSSF
jgi:gamma-glutamylputrescine oxidase